MNRRSNFYRNAVAESFFATLTRDLTLLKWLATRSEVKREIFESSKSPTIAFEMIRG